MNTTLPGNEFTPSAGLLDSLVAELRRHAPFAQMAVDHVASFVAAAKQTYHAPGEVVAAPADGPAPRIYYIRRGSVTVKGGLADYAEGGVSYEAGDVFPASAVAGERAVGSSYEADGDLFCLAVDATVARALAARSGP